MRSLYIVTSILALTATVSTQKCFLPDGTQETTTDNYVPCGNGTDFSHCCTDRDECTTNGLCKGSFQTTVNWYWRESCTDPTWQSAACPKYCLNDDLDPGTTGEDRLIFACSTDTYCCAAVPRSVAIELPFQNNYSCCADSARLFTAGPAVRLSGVVVETTTFPIVPTSTAKYSDASHTGTAIASTTTSNTITPTSDPSSINKSSSSSGLTNNAKLGLAAGIPAGFVVSAGLGILIWWYRRKPASKMQVPLPYGFYEAPDHKALIPEMYVSPQVPVAQTRYGQYEAVETQNRSSGERAELPGHSTYI